MVSNLSKNRINNLNCVLGLDCSKYQKDINWATAKTAGIEFAYIKITEGTTSSEDEIYNLKARILSAEQNGVKVGYYHFARPGNVAEPENDAMDEVYNVLHHLDLLPKVKLPLALDIEAYSDPIIWDNKIDHMNKFITTFMNEMKEHEVPALIYSYRSFLDDNTTHTFGSYPLWIAAYPNDPENSLPSIPVGWSEWKIWQFTEKGLISGYNGDIDLDIMKKEYFNLF